jgi:hypothetical protein
MEMFCTLWWWWAKPVLQLCRVVYIAGESHETLDVNKEMWWLNGEKVAKRPSESIFMDRLISMVLTGTQQMIFDIPLLQDRLITQQGG